MMHARARVHVRRRQSTLVVCSNPCQSCKPLSNGFEQSASTRARALVSLTRLCVRVRASGRWCLSGVSAGRVGEWQLGSRGAREVIQYSAVTTTAAMSRDLRELASASTRCYGPRGDMAPAYSREN
eukprot:75219-Pleurochrysis_carterae.AAC.1